MQLEVEVISKEIIKPLSPTPESLRHYQLSFLDQISPPVYNPLVLFYPSKCNVQANKMKTSAHLKQSISKVLTHFYPLAGLLKDNLFIDCNDEGIPYLEAKVKSQLSDVIGDSSVPSELNKLLPFPLEDAESLPFPLGIQLNIFYCGGIGIGICVSHKIADALSFLTFIKTWAAIAREEPESDIVFPEFASARLFPPRCISGYKPGTGITKENVVTKRFVFSASKIEEIRAKYANNSASALEKQKRPSRVEALSAFIWSRFAAATKIKSRPDKFYTIIHAVNLRPRLDPPLPDHSFGNLYRISITIPSIDNGDNYDEDCFGLVSQMRESIRKISEEYVKNLKEGQNHFEFIKEKAERFIRGEMFSFNFTSLCRFPLYEADFGWGKPLWVGSCSLTFKNLVVFMDAASGGGIEAWINLAEEDMAAFGRDEALLACVGNVN